VVIDQVGDEGVMKSQLCELNKKRLSTLRRLLVVGDLHGDYPSLHAVLNRFDPNQDVLVFLGDYADRGSSGVEVIETVDALAKKHPENVFPLKGNHEEYSDNGIPKFYPCNLIEEVNQKNRTLGKLFHKQVEPLHS
jgi:predicted MPP superfamily phosphohydrolase